MPSMIQGLDTIPQAIAKEFVKLFSKYLPGWNVNGIYNYQAGTASQQAAGQLELLMQYGEHPWINKALKTLLMDLENNPIYAGKQTQYLAALVKFMYEANGTQALLKLRGHDTNSTYFTRL